jgi:hypothetical protein
MQQMLLCCCLLHACHIQLLVRAAYEGALAHPLIPDPENLQHLTPETLATFVAQNYTGVRGTAARGLTKVRFNHGGIGGIKPIP